MSVTARSAAIDAFMKDPSVKVILISLKAGGVALNLTVATHIFIMDPYARSAAPALPAKAHPIPFHSPRP
jgi:DNA repair protein RAD16